MITSLTVTTVLFAGLCSGNASPAGITHMTISKMGMADLTSSAGGYAYKQQGGFPVSYTRYTNHGSGRYYHAPAPLHYVGRPAPVASAVPETASLHEPSALLAYATARHEIAPYATPVPYPRDGFINYSADQLTKYAQPPERRRKPSARAPYYTPNASEASEIDENIDNRSDRAEDFSRNSGINCTNSDEDEEGEMEDRSATEDSDLDDIAEKADAPGAARAIENPVDDLRANIDVSSELVDGVNYSSEQNSAHGEKIDEGYGNRKEFDVGEREQHDKSEQRGHYESETGNRSGRNDTAKNYGRYDVAKEDEKGGSYEQTSYHKKGQKTSGFHKVYHKDEYKKDSDFYDESHKKGSFDKYAVADEHHNAAEGDYEEGGQRASGFDYEDREREDHYDQERTRNRDRGYNKENGEDSFREEFEDYNSDKDTRLMEKHVHRKVDDHH